MDRSKSRTDLLQAGRKKLQQFRQKKDSKGGSSRGKSLKKSDKTQLTESGADGQSSTFKSIVSSQVTDGDFETDSDSNVISRQSFESHSLSNSFSHDSDIDPNVDSSSVAITNSTGNETELGSDSKLALHDRGVLEIASDMSSQDKERVAQDFAVAEAEDVSLRTSDNLGPEGGGETNDYVSAPVDILSSSTSVATAVGEPITVQREGDTREESLLLSVDLPNTSLTQTKEDQDPDGVDLKKSFQSTDVEEASHEAEQLGKSVEVFSSTEDIVADNLSAPDQGQGDGIVISGHTRNLEGETLSGSSYNEMLLQSSQEQTSEGALGGHDRGLQEAHNQQWTPAGSAADSPTHELAMGSHEVNLAGPLDVFPIFGASSVNLLQLAEFIRGLNEEEYQFLLNLRGVVSDADPLAICSVLSDHDFLEAFQRLKEELFLASLMKNIFNMQLTEQLELQLQSDNQRYQLVDKLSQLQGSHNEVNEKNQRLIEELANCRVELQEVSRKSVVLQNQFGTAKAEVEALSARVVELQIGFEISQQDSLDLSSELADCRALISSLQAEKKGMNENLELVIAERDKLVDEQEFHLCESKKLSTELADFKRSIEGVTAENSELIERISLVTEERNKIKEEVEHFSNEIEGLSLDLAQNKALVESLQAENSNLNGNLAMSADRIKNLEGENQFIVLENQSLSSQIVALQEQLSLENNERMRLEGDLKEATMHLEQISKENIFLHSTLDGQKAMIAEIGKKHSQPLSPSEEFRNQAHVSRDQRKGLQIVISKDRLCMDQQPEVGVPGGTILNLHEDVFDDSLGFVSLKSCLDEMEKILVKLEKASNECHSHSASFGRFVEEVSSPVVSKLIQAFESKRREDAHEVDEGDSNEVQSSSNSFNMLIKEETENMRKLLSRWKVHLQSAAALFKGEQEGRKIGDAKYSVLMDQFEELKQHCSNLELSNIELTVQWEAAVQLLGEIQETKCHLEQLFEALNQDAHLKAKNNELYEKLGHCQTKVSEMYTEICDVKESSNEMASVIGGQLENLQKEVTQRAMLLEQGWNTTIAEIIELVGKLNESVGKNLSSTVSFDVRYISHQLAISVNAATETILDLQKKLEATCSEHEILSSSFKEVNLKCDDLLGRNELAFGVLNKMYNDLRKLVLSHSGLMDEDKIDVQSEALPDLLNYDSYQTIMNCLGDILNEKLELESITNEMKSKMMQTGAELEELKVKCLDLDTVSKLIEDVASILNVEYSKIEINKAPLSCLDSLVSSLVEKTRKAEIQLHLSREGYGSKEMELDELKKTKHCQETVHFEKENEILVLKESLLQAEDALTAARSELHQKTNELEHSEQRVSSIREKLSIAVARGKGLVVQRDGLKQSLAETSGELERCLEELQLKDARLHEVETKLKTYAEAGERMEAMESELSYIRNSSNALRESFLLKDSMLQRIEEALEDLDLPEQFHSGDIIEKIDWLARSVAGSSLPMNDWDQKDSAGGGSYSDAGYVATDSWKEDSQVPPDSGDDSWKVDSQLQPDSGDDSWKVDSQLLPDSEDVQEEEQHEQKQQQQPPDFVPLDGDDLRKKFGELQSKFYGLAEQNEMLEQSLMERNSLVQRWEELIDRIDIPSHLRSMEMEDRIEWVGRALAEANHHVDSLQLKIEKYDSYCGLLNSDLEESQRTVSVLQTDLRALMTEREHLSEKLEALIFDCEKLSTQARQTELENEKLHNEIASLKDTLEQKFANEEQLFTIESKLRNLRHLVSDALPESDTKKLVSGNANIDSLEELVRKLIEALITEREHLSENLEALKCECEKISAQATQVEHENEMLHNEIASLKDILEQKVAVEEQIFTTDGRLKNLQDLVSGVLSEPETLNLVSGTANMDSLEELVRKLIDALMTERDHLPEKLKALKCESEKLSAQAKQAELENGMLHNEIASLKDILEQKVAVEEQISTIDGRLKNLQDLVSAVLPDTTTLNLVLGSANIDSLEELVRKLIGVLMTEREQLSEKLEAVKCECEKLSAQAKQAELENEMLHNEIASLKDILEQKVAVEEQIFTIDGRLKNLQDLVSAVLPDSETLNLVSGSANIDSLEELVRKLIGALMTEREHLSEKLEALKCECNKQSAQAKQAELENEMMHKEIASMKDIFEQKVAVEEQIFTSDGRLKHLQDLVCGVLPESETLHLVSGSANIDSLEELLRKLIEDHTSLRSMKPTNGVELDGDHQQKDDGTHVEARSVDMHDKEADIDRYKKDMEEALSQLEHVKEERDRTLEKQISLSSEVEALSKRIEELQELLNLEEQKSASVREKLNLAVRKGKSLVQHRDSLKQTIEGMGIEMEQLKSEINNRENALAEHAQKLRQMSTYPERLEALESESIYLKNHLAETEHCLQEKEYSLQLILNKLAEIEVHGEGRISDPVKKLECIGKLCSDLHGTVATLEQESRKSKRASELLLAELNEVQERNDAFQEELAKVAAELVDLRKHKESAEVARLEALSHLEKLSVLHDEGKKSHFSEIMGLKSSMNQLFQGFGEVQHLLANAFIMDLESLQNLEAGLESCMKGSNAKIVMDSSVAKNHEGILPRSSEYKKSSLSSDSWSDFDSTDHYKDDTIVESFHHLRHQLQEILAEISSFKERIAMHSSSVQEQDKNLFKLMVSVEREMTSQRESCETMREKIREQDGELIALRGNIDYLCEACINSVTVIENRKGELVGNTVEFSDLGINLKNPPSEKSIITLADRLLMAAKEVSSIRTEVLAVNQNEMKATITSMQRELQEKDVQRERICSQLVKQIKDAEAVANSYSEDLQSLRIQEQNLKKQVEVIEAERKILEERVNELQDSQGTAAEFKEKIRSQTDLLAAKDQEIESLMHALDEEEVQMEELAKKIEELEKVVQQKSQEIENLESSRGKVMKKLAITVSKFDELHLLSASLLSEVEKHQSQLQERDAEISFLRQEVTRCTKDVLLASQMSNQRNSDDIFEFLMWIDMMVSQEGMHVIEPDAKNNSQVHEYKEILHKKLMSVLSELENLKATTEIKDVMLQLEREKVEELNRKAETLEKSLHEKEMQLNLLEGAEETGKEATTNSEILEVDPVTNEWTATGTFVTPQIRSLRKGNNDHVAIVVDEDPASTSRIEDEEDDKVHGFKSLNSSKIVPRFTRPLTDLIDGLWVSCDRTLMRRPILRLGIIMYWAMMHALLAFFVV